MNGRTSLITVLKAIISTKVHHHHHFLHPNIFPRGFLRHLLPTLVCRNYLANIVRYLDFKTKSQYLCTRTIKYFENEMHFFNFIDFPNSICLCNILSVSPSIMENLGEKVLLIVY